MPWGDWTWPSGGTESACGIWCHSAAICCYLWNLVLQCGCLMSFPAISCYLSRATFCSYMLFFAMLGCCYLLLFAAICCCLLVFAAICSCLLLVVAIYCCLLLLAAVCCFFTVVCFFWLRIPADCHFMFFAASFRDKNWEFLLNSWKSNTDELGSKK